MWLAEGTDNLGFGSEVGVNLTSGTVKSVEVVTNSFGFDFQRIQQGVVHDRKELKVEFAGGIGTQMPKADGHDGGIMSGLQEIEIAQ
jgi:hypothetical protein